MRFVMHYVPPWVFHLADALEAGDMPAAREICIRVSSEAPVQFNPHGPFDHVMRMVVAHADDNAAWLEEAEAFLATDVQRSRWEPGTEPHECVLATYFLAGLMRLQSPDRAAAHFEAALALTPTFLPARVELEILRSGRARKDVFAALGVEPPMPDWAYKLAASQLDLATRTASTPRNAGAICLRGLCTEQTPALVRLYRWLNPETPIFVATWRDTPQHLLESIGQSAHIVLAPEPDMPGSQNKNRQIVLARAALIAARNYNISSVLLLRTDIALFRNDIIDHLESVHRTYPAPPGALSGRFIVSDIFTRKFMALHVSDILTYGCVDDLIRLWSAPYETDGGHQNTEQYLVGYLFNGLQLKYKETSMDAYYRFLREFVVVRDFSWFDGFWLKHPDMRTASAQAFADACISQLDWERLYHAPQSCPPDEMGSGDVGVVLHAALGLSRF